MSEYDRPLPPDDACDWCGKPTANRNCPCGIKLCDRHHRECPDCGCDLEHTNSDNDEE